MPHRAAVVISCVVILASATGAQAAAPQAERRMVDIPPRTPLYCEDSANKIQPFVYGDFGDFIDAYARLEHWPAVITTNGKRADGEDYDVVLFTAPENDPDAAGEMVGYVITSYEDGYALRSVYDQPPGLPSMKRSGNDLCFFVQGMMMEANPARAAAFRRAWDEKHPDSTTP